MKTAIVTGASGNLGQAVVKKFLEEGYIVVGTVIPNDPVELNITNKNFEKIIVDLMSEDEAEKLIHYVIWKYKSIDAAVLTVGGFAMGKILQTKASDIIKQYKLNFEVTYNVARPAFLQMLEQKSGHIFMVGSRLGSDMKQSKGMIAYGLSKSLIFRLAELMNDEGKEHGVVTAVIVPSTIDTPQNRKSMPDADFSRWVKAEEIASVIYFYCSEAASVLREPIIKVYGNS
jgi:NAD(P)-dependent dehydrogenase (short-subunit alcohol dehydrogenase family)